MRGQVLVLVIVFLTVILITTLSIFSLVSFFTRNATLGYFSEQALHLAEAGVDKAIYELNAQGSAYTGEANTVLADGTFTVAVSDVSFGVKEITSTGFIPNSQNSQAKKKIKVRVNTGSQNISFRYAVQIGLGGLEMNSNAEINGNAYSNSSIVGFSNTKINGDATAVTTISSPKPIVTGKRCSSVETADCPDGQAPQPQPMPNFDPNYWKDKADDGGTQSSLTFLSCSPSQKLGPRKIEGNLLLDSNSCLTLTGPIWVTGNFEMNSNTNLYLDSSFDSLGTVLVVDGKIQINSNTIIHPTGSSPKGYILLASTKTDAAAPAGPAIILDSNAAGGVYYALPGTAHSNSNAGIVAIATNKLVLDSNAILNYDLGLQSAQFSSGPGGSWGISSGTYKIE